MSDTSKIDITDFDSHQWLQIEQAARGCVSGTLEECQELNRALMAGGISLPQDTDALSLKRICQMMVSSFYSEMAIDQCVYYSTSAVKYAEREGSEHEWCRACSQSIKSICDAFQASRRRVWGPEPKTVATE